MMGNSMSTDPTDDVPPFSTGPVSDRGVFAGSLSTGLQDSLGDHDVRTGHLTADDDQVDGFDESDPTNCWPGMDAEPAAAEPESTMSQLRANPVTRWLIDWVPILIGAFLLALFVRAFAFQAFSIPSGSMIPTLQIDDRVLVNKLSYTVGDVSRGDVVVFKRPENSPGQFDDLIKRVIGLPGDTITISNGELFVNGFLLEESYIARQSSTAPLRVGEIPGCLDATPTECTVPDDRLLVFGDNRQSSTDGREFGTIPVDDVVGRAFVKVWPLTDIGWL